MLDNSVDRFEKRLEQGVICFIRQQKARRGHRGEQLEEFRASHGRQMLGIGSYIVDNSEQRRIDCVQLTLAASN